MRVTDLNNRTVAPQRGYTLQLEHPRSVNTSADGVSRRVATKNSYFALVVNFNANELEPGRYFFENLKVDVQITLDDGKRTFSQPVSLYSVVPNFLAAVSGYDLKTRRGAFPDELTQLWSRWLRDLGCASGTPARLYADFNEAATPRGAGPAWLSLVDSRLRLAGIARQTANLALADRSMSPDEYQQLRDAMVKYHAACLIDEQRRP